MLTIVLIILVSPDGVTIFILFLCVCVSVFFFFFDWIFPNNKILTTTTTFNAIPQYKEIKFHFVILYENKFVFVASVFESFHDIYVGANVECINWCEQMLTQLVDLSLLLLTVNKFVTATNMFIYVCIVVVLLVLLLWNWLSMEHSCIQQPKSIHNVALDSSSQPIKLYLKLDFILFRRDKSNEKKINVEQNLKKNQRNVSYSFSFRLQTKMLEKILLKFSKT